MAWESLKQGIKIPDPAAEYKKGIRVDQYRITDAAVFLPRQKYIPLDCVEKIQVRKGMLSVGACCGKGVPVYNIIIFYGTDRPERLIVERSKNAERLADLIVKSRKHIFREEFVLREKIKDAGN